MSIEDDLAFWDGQFSPANGQMEMVSAYPEMSEAEGLIRILLQDTPWTVVLETDTYLEARISKPIDIFHDDKTPAGTVIFSEGSDSIFRVVHKIQDGNEIESYAYAWGPHPGLPVVQEVTYLLDEAGQPETGRVRPSGPFQNRIEEIYFLINRAANVRLEAEPDNSDTTEIILNDERVLEKFDALMSVPAEDGYLERIEFFKLLTEELGCSQEECSQIFTELHARYGVSDD